MVDLIEEPAGKGRRGDGDQLRAVDAPEDADVLAVTIAFVERLPEHRLEGPGLERLAELQHAERDQQPNEAARRRQQEVAGELERERADQAGLPSPPIRRDAGGHFHRERGDDGHRLGEADAGVVGEAEVEEDPDAEPEAQARQRGDEVEEPEVRHARNLAWFLPRQIC